MSRKRKNNKTSLVERDLKKMYDAGEKQRSEYLTQAENNAKLTIPSSMPPAGHAEGQVLPSPYQSIGARGLNTLTSKVMEGLFPAGSPYCQFQIDDLTLDALKEDMMSGTIHRGEIDGKLNQIERALLLDFEASGMRASLYEALLQVINSGNYLLVQEDSGNLKGFRLNRYILKRDAEGNLLHAVIKEKIALTALSKEVREFVEKAQAERAAVADDSDQSDEEESEVDIYTLFERRGQRISKVQTVHGYEIPGTTGSWPLDKSPVIALRFFWVHGEDYGRAYTTQYYGDLMAAEKLQKAIIEASAAAAKVVPMVRPGGVTRASDIARAENLEVVSGRADDVTMLQLDKQADMRIAQTTLNDILKRLAQNFLMTQAIQRDAERVTAAEIRAIVNELENALGGVYTLLAGELQLALVRRQVDRLERQGHIPRLSDLKGPDGKQTIKIKIISGIDALGRGRDYSKYQSLLAEVIAPLGKEAFSLLNVPELINRAGAALGISMEGLVKTPEELQKEQQMAQQQMMQQQMLEAAKSAAGPAVKALSDQQLAAQTQQQPPSGE